ncbi:MAG: CopG family antitoxin [Pseudomonadota bacterium]
MTKETQTLKPLPILDSDQAAERFVAEADLTQFDLSAMRPMRFEFEKKSTRTNIRMPQSLLDAVKAQAKARGIPYQRWIRQVLEEALDQRRS